MRELTKYRTISIVLACLLACVVRAQIAVQWSPSDFTLQYPASQQIGIQPLWTYTVFGTNIVTGQMRTFSTGTCVTTNGQTVTGAAGTLIVSNVIPGGYAVNIYSQGLQLPAATFTNVFSNGTPAFVNAKDFVAVSTNSVNGSGFAYTQSQSDARYVLQGDALFSTNAVIPGITNGEAAFYFSNYDLYLVSPTVTNLIKLGH